MHKRANKKLLYSRGILLSTPVVTQTEGKSKQEGDTYTCIADSLLLVEQK